MWKLTVPMMSTIMSKKCRKMIEEMEELLIV